MSALEVLKIMAEAVKAYPVDKRVGIENAPAWNIKTASKALNVSVSTVRNWVKNANNTKIPFWQKTPNSPIFFKIQKLIEWDNQRN